MLQHPPRLIAERYEVLDLIGEGGMATIHRVVDSTTQTQLALKQLRPSDGEGNDLRVAHFEREFVTLKQLAHPRIIRVYDFGFDGERPYYTMELLDGQDARELAPLDWNIACALLRDVASSLALVHSRRLVYRDLSPRNVRCTSDGRAKLLDFGALTSVGVPSQIVGTPAFIAPEALFGQPLDQRSDLYSLGALAYWLLTGQTAYRARELGELRDAWRTRPAAPAALVAGVPEALSSLVMSLLSHNPTGRPQHAGEVIDKLSAIGKLATDHDLGVIGAYLSTPELLGREEQLLRLRKALVRATRGRGGAFLLRAEPGGGRTRMIDVCVLESKLVGALVARVDAASLRRGSFAALRGAITQWCSGLPAPLAEKLASAAPRADQPGNSLPMSGSISVHTRIANDILEIARQRALVLAIDDAHDLDAPSVAVFALLARAADAHKLLVCASVPTTSELADSVPLRMLMDATSTLSLEPWTLAQTESLLYSLFGQVPNVPLLADRVHHVARGNARDTMNLAQHLVDSGVVTHHAGAWSLPVRLDEVALPGSMEHAQRSTIEALGADDRQFAAMLALEPELPRLDLTLLAQLSAHALARLEVLSQQGVLVARHAGFAFRHRGLAEALRASLGDADKRALHERLRALHEAAGHHPLTLAYHLHCAGDVEGCLRRVLPWLAEVGTPRLNDEQAELLQVIASDAERYQLSVVDRHRVRAVLVQHAALSDPSYGQHGEASFDQLRLDTGLCYWDEHPELDPVQRIGQCLQRAQAAYESTPADQRGLPPIDAIRELAVLVRSMTSVYARTLASDKLIALGAWLEPLRPLAPIIQLLHELTLTTIARAVREKRVAHRFLELAAQFDQPLLGVDDASRSLAAAVYVYCAALDEAKQGKPSALTRVAPLESRERFAALAWHVRMLSHIYSGRTREAEQCRQSMQLLVIERDQPVSLLAMSVLYEAWGYEMCEDLTGLKGALEQVEQEARRFPGWQPWAALYRGDVNRLRGDLDAALSCYEQAAAMTAPGRHQVWPHAAERRVVTLRLLGRFDEALTLGRASVDYALAEDMEPVNVLRTYVALAAAQTEAGLLADAAVSIDSALLCAEREGIDGVPLAVVHEARARLAIRYGDAAAFESARSVCAERLLAGDNPALTAKYERMLHEARSAGLLQTGLRPLEHPSLVQLRAVSDATQRASQVLAALADHYTTDRGWLFGLTEDGSKLIADLGEVAIDDALWTMVDEYLAAELGDQDFVTVTRQDEHAAISSGHVWPADGEHVYAPLLLRARERGLVCGLALLRVKQPLPPAPDVDLLDALAQALLCDAALSGVPEAR
jgi:tetratricopeptide (TPR) repeat protein